MCCCRVANTHSLASNFPLYPARRLLPTTRVSQGCYCVGQLCASHRIPCNGHHWLRSTWDSCRIIRFLRSLMETVRRNVPHCCRPTHPTGVPTVGSGGRRREDALHHLGTPVSKKLEGEVPEPKGILTCILDVSFTKLNL